MRAYRKYLAELESDVSKLPSSNKPADTSSEMRGVKNENHQKFYRDQLGYSSWLSIYKAHDFQVRKVQVN